MINSIETTESILNQQNDENIQIKTAFGLDINSTNTVGFINNTLFYYLIGSNLVTYDMENLKQKLTPIKSKGRIEIIKISFNQKYALFCDIEQKNSHLFMLDLTEPDLPKRLKRFKTLENEQILTMNISNDTELISCHTNYPNWNIYIFSFSFIQLAKLNTINSVQSNNQTVENISFLPNDNKRILLIGNNLLRIYFYTKNGLKLVYNLNCDFLLFNYSWLNKNELISFDKYGNIFLIEPKQNIIRTVQLNEPDSSSSIDLSTSSLITTNKETSSLFQTSKTILKNVSNNNNNKSRLFINNSSIKCLKCARKGFFICYSNDDRVYFYENANNYKNTMFTYTLKFTLKLKKPSQIDNNLKEFIINILLNDNQTYLIAITNLKRVYFYELNDLFSNVNNEQVNLELILDKYHSESITGIDYCVRKSFIVTCSLDRFVIIWNYDTNSIELKQQFDEDLFTVAFHPSGLYVILSTTNSLKYMSIYSDTFKINNVLNVRSCTNCIFSNGGHTFAFVHGTIIQVYSTIKFEEIGSIKAQDMGKIKQLRFSKDDQYLMCCSMAGIIRIWNSYSLILICEIMSKGLSYIGMDLHPNQEWIFLISTEKSIRQFQLPISDEFKSLIKPNSEARLVKKYETRQDENVTCIEISKSGKMICIGTNKGYIRIYLLSTGVYKDYKAHFGSVNKICITYGDECLISTSDDGSMILWNIGNKLKETFNQINQSNDECLIDRDDYLNRSKVILNYEAKLKETKVETNFKLRMKELKFNIKQRELKNRFNTQMIELKEKIDLLESDNAVKVENFNSEFNKLIHDNLIEFELVYQSLKSKIETENFKNENLKQKIESLKCEIKLNESKLNELRAHIELSMFETMDLKLNSIREQHLNEIKMYQKEIDDLIKFEYDLEDEFENEFYKENINFEHKLLKLIEENDLIKIEIKNLNINFKTQKSLILDYLKAGYKPENDINEIKNRIKELDELELALKNEIELKQNELNESELELNNLTKELELIELDNFNLNKKIQFNLRTELEPAKSENKYLNYDLVEIKKEIKQKNLELAKLRNDVLNLKSKIKLNKK